MLSIIESYGDLLEGMSEDIKIRIGSFVTNSPYGVGVQNCDFLYSIQKISVSRNNWIRVTAYDVRSNNIACRSKVNGSWWEWDFVPYRKMYYADVTNYVKKGSGVISIGNSSNMGVRLNRITFNHYVVHLEPLKFVISSGFAYIELADFTDAFALYGITSDVAFSTESAFVLGDTTNGKTFSANCYFTYKSLWLRFIYPLSILDMQANDTIDIYGDIDIYFY